MGRKAKQVQRQRQAQQKMRPAQCKQDTSTDLQITPTPAQVTEIDSSPTAPAGAEQGCQPSQDQMPDRPAEDTQENSFTTYADGTVPGSDTSPAQTLDTVPTGGEHLKVQPGHDETSADDTAENTEHNVPDEQEHDENSAEDIADNAEDNVTGQLEQDTSSTNDIAENTKGNVLDEPEHDEKSADDNADKTQDNVPDQPEQGKPLNNDTADNTANKSVDYAPDLIAEDPRTLLQQIIGLRTYALDDLVDLPQLVVCGDQSAGKRSVLERLTGIQLPHGEGASTKFPVEFILEHTDGAKAIHATIIPSKRHEPVTKLRLANFSRTIDSRNSISTVIAQAGELMGVGKIQDDSAFGEDVLRIKVTGPTQLQLSIIDVPSLVPESDKRCTADYKLAVRKVVDSYIRKSRTIILAVIPATNSVVNQGIVIRCRKYDKLGQRTIGIITKSDLIELGSEQQIALLAKNESTPKFERGFFLLKNPTSTEVENGLSIGTDSAHELHFFRSPQWQDCGLDFGCVGLASLVSSIQALFSQHVEEELPKVRDEIRSLIKQTEDELRAPLERSSSKSTRDLLSGLAAQYRVLATASINGDYCSNPEFFTLDGSDIPTSRLRAKIQHSNALFAFDMAQKGHTLNVIDTLGAANELSDSTFGLEFDKDAKIYKRKTPVLQQMGFEKAEHLERGSEDGMCSSPYGLCQTDVTMAEMKIWIQKMYLSSRGRELSASHNHSLLYDMFQQQSMRWMELATEHVNQVHASVSEFVTNASITLGIENCMPAELQENIVRNLQTIKALAEEELAKLCEDEERQLITYNNDYAKALRKFRTEFMRNPISKANGTEHVDNRERKGETLSRLPALLEEDYVTGMDEQACAEALVRLNSYYKIARNTFVDNVCRQVIERHLVANVPNLFGPDLESGYSNEDLFGFTGEDPAVTEHRAGLQERLNKLKAALADLST